MQSSQLSFTLGALRHTRNNILKILHGFSIEEINFIPPGFNNNLAWNFGHVLVTQQRLSYKLAGLDMHIGEELNSAYQKGTKPEKDLDQVGLKHLRELSETLVKQFQRDYINGLFKAFKTYPTSYGVLLSCIEDAIIFNNMHEALHLGTCIALKKALLLKQS